MSIRVLITAAVLLALAGCSSTNDTSSLKQYLHDQHQYAHNYSALDGANYSSDDSGVTIKTTLYTEATDGQDICNWASEWMYDQGKGSGSIRVLNRDGDVLSQRRAEQDVCSFG